MSLPISRQEVEMWVIHGLCQGGSLKLYSQRVELELVRACLK